MYYSINNFKEVLKRVLKYFIEGLVVSFVAFWIPRRKMDIEEIVVIAITAATTFAVLDMWAPSTLSNAARWGAGFGIGASLGAGSAGPIFPAENFIATIDTTDGTSTDIANPASPPMAAAVLPTDTANPASPPMAAAVLPTDTANPASPPMETSVLSTDSPSIDKKNINSVPPAFTSKFVPNYECTWEVDDRMVIDGFPEGYIGRCVSKNGLRKIIKDHFTKSK